MSENEIGEVAYALKPLFRRYPKMVDGHIEALLRSLPEKIREVARKVMADNAGAVGDYGSGKQQALTFLVGQVMKATRGRANPGMVREIIEQELGGK